MSLPPTFNIAPVQLTDEKQRLLPTCCFTGVQYAAINFDQRDIKQQLGFLPFSHSVGFLIQKDYNSLKLQGYTTWMDV